MARTDGAGEALMMDEVMISGVGVVSCLGPDAGAFWTGLGSADGMPARADDPDAHMRLPLMYKVTAPLGPDPRPGGAGGAPDGAPDGGPDGGPDADRARRFAVAAALEALRDAGIDPADAATGPISVVVGTGMGEAGSHERAAGAGTAGAGTAGAGTAGAGTAGEAPGEDGWRPTFTIAAAVAEAIADSGGAGVAHAPVSVSNACAASGFAISAGADLIRAGEADVVVAGGAEAYSRVALGCFNRLGAIDPLRCRPFDADRHGTVFGEGAAMVVLESARHAAARAAAAGPESPHGAPGPAGRYGRLAGAGWSCDAYHLTAPEPGGTQIERGMLGALAEAGIGADDVGVVVPHGTGTELNDVVESEVLRRLFGERAPRVPLYSLKAAIGHTGGAAGALAVAAAALILRHGHVPANVAVGELDPDCPVWLPRVAEGPPSGRYALVNAYAFGGNNVSLVLAGPAR